MRRLGIESMELRKVGFQYAPDTRVFTDVDFRFSEGEVIYLQGPRGSGKNTLMKILLGLLAPTEGEYLLNGVSVNDFSHSEFDPYRLNIGHSFDVGGLINNQTLYENFRLLLDYHAFQAPDARFDYIVDMLERFNLEDIKHIRPAFISSSERKAACVLRAFALRPEVVILDNPTQGMSIEHIPALVALLRDHQQNHSLKHVIISSDDVGLMNQLPGRIITVTSTGLREERSLRRVG